MAFASASRRAISISNSFPEAYSSSPTNRMTHATTGEIELTSAGRTTSNAAGADRSSSLEFEINCLAIEVWPRGSGSESHALGGSALLAQKAGQRPRPSRITLLWTHADIGARPWDGLISVRIPRPGVTGG